VLTERFRPESDVDMLVEFEAGHTPGYFGLTGMEIELPEKLGRNVDLPMPLGVEQALQKHGHRWGVRSI
jgi:predicted nucleotidyltransferase